MIGCGRLKTLEKQVHANERAVLTLQERTTAVEKRFDDIHIHSDTLINRVEALSLQMAELQQLVKTAKMMFTLMITLVSIGVTLNALLMDMPGFLTGLFGG